MGERGEIAEEEHEREYYEIWNQLSLLDIVTFIIIIIIIGKVFYTINFICNCYQIWIWHIDSKT